MVKNKWILQEKNQSSSKLFSLKVKIHRQAQKWCSLNENKRFFFLLWALLLYQDFTIVADISVLTELIYRSCQAKHQLTDTNMFEMKMTSMKVGNLRDVKEGELPHLLILRVC